MTRLIDADALIKKWENVHSKDTSFAMAVIGAINDVKKAPTVDAVPSQLTNEEIATIRIHINAFKERLCNQHRWKEAEEYQQIVDKLDTMMDAERKDA